MLSSISWQIYEQLYLQEENLDKFMTWTKW